MTNYFLALEAIEIFGIKAKDITSLNLIPYTDDPKHFSAYIHLNGTTAQTMLAKELAWKPLDNHSDVMHATVTLQHLDGVKLESYIFVK